MIYILESDDDSRELIRYTLQQSGLESIGFSESTVFRQAMEKRIPVLLILNPVLKDSNGLSLLRQMRASEELRTLPIILYSEKNSEYDRVIGLDSGADDYIGKQTGGMELISRVRALLRRSAWSLPQTEKDGEIPRRFLQLHPVSRIFRAGTLYVDTERYFVRAGEQEISLTCKEFSLLCTLLENRGIVMTRDRLLNEIWGYAFNGESRTVDVHIRTLRQKLGKDGALIETIRGIGYRMAADSG